MEGQQEPGKGEPESKASKSEEEGEIEEGEDIASSSKSRDMELKELRASLKWVLHVCDEVIKKYMYSSSLSVEVFN